MTSSILTDIRPLALSSLLGAGCGGITGFALGGPGGALFGAKTGWSLGAQTGILYKADKALDLTGNKIIQGIDNAGRKVEVIADKTGTAIEKVGNVASTALYNFCDVLSKMLLTGVALELGMRMVDKNALSYNQLCQSAFESINCLGMSLTSISLNTLCVASTLSIIRQVYKLTK